jgi:hypothetical protein
MFWNFDNLDVSFIHSWHLTPISGSEIISVLEILCCCTEFLTGCLEYHCLSCSNCRDILWNCVNIRQSTFLGQLELCSQYNVYPVYVNWYVISTCSWLLQTIRYHLIVCSRWPEKHFTNCLLQYWADELINWSQLCLEHAWFQVL